MPLNKKGKEIKKGSSFFIGFDTHLQITRVQSLTRETPFWFIAIRILGFGVEIITRKS